ncbi:thiol reductant ABC exporter subunit CydD [Cobetia marina]|uniref:thiol reductant ABC exporter subunit CydD n=1 Tax=Cobetia marina TaxID=28258 RepID=UPI0021005BCF|nr:thiol reductant ABC exporter subunit CydD [Cobetia marina]
MLGFSALSGVVAGILTVAQLVLTAWVITEAIEHPESLGALWWPFIGLLGLLGARVLASGGQELLAQRASQRLRQAIRGEVLTALETLGPVRAAQYHSADLAQRWVEQVEALEGYFARFHVQMRLVVITPLLILAIVVSLDWLAAILLALTAPLIPLFMALVGMGAESLNRDQFQAVARLSRHFVDRVRAITTLRLFGLGELATREVTLVADDYRKRSLRTLRLAFLSSAVLEFFASVSIAVVAIYIGFGLLGDIPIGPADELTLFSALVILLLAPEFFQPLRTLSQFYHDRASALAASETLMEILEAADMASPRHADTRPDATGELMCLTDVCLSHPERGQVLGPLDLALRQGEVLVVSGASGAGKSTLLQVMAGFVAPDSGQRQIAPATRLAWMDQRPLLMQGSLADNLRITAPQASDAEIITALERAGLKAELAALPQGIATPLGEGGRGLSGGQAQRLALARVFLSDASLVLLDEPTASLDAETERYLIAGFEWLSAQGRTLVIATHHPALIAMATRHLVLEEGRILPMTATATSQQEDERDASRD